MKIKFVPPVRYGLEGQSCLPSQLSFSFFFTHSCTNERVIACHSARQKKLTVVVERLHCEARSKQLATLTVGTDLGASPVLDHVNPDDCQARVLGRGLSAKNACHASSNTELNELEQQARSKNSRASGDRHQRGTRHAFWCKLNNGCFAEQQ